MCFVANVAEHAMRDYQVPVTKLKQRTKGWNLEDHLPVKGTSNLMRGKYGENEAIKKA